MLQQKYKRLRIGKDPNLKKSILKGIPVLSIFALLGMNMMLFGVFYDDVPDTYAAGSTSSGTFASLIIDNGKINDKIYATHGETAYASHVVKVSASNITDYALTITGPTSLTGTSTISGASGATGANLSDNTWGYAWDDKDVAEAEMTYSSFTGAAQTLTGNPAVNNNAVDFERKLAFAAKFSQDAVEGHYTASVNLNLVATPHIVVLGFGGIEKMQDMTPEICASAPDGLVGQLYDTRDNNSYLVQKVGSRCWMVQNLSLAGGTKITSADSDVTSDYTLKDSTSGNFVNDNTSEQMRDADNSIYGAYYSWCAATANTCDSVASGADAASSICPKGWQLPKGGTGATNDFAVALGYTTPISGNPNIWSSITPIPALTNGNLTINGVTWSAAGFVDNNGLVLTGSQGRYWSRTASNANFAHYLNFSSGYLYPATADAKHIGYPVRCIAKEPEVTGFGGITKMQDMTPDICSKASGSGELYDTRDASVYTVQKVGDKCWMAQNLSLAGGMTLKTTDSNVSADYTLKASTYGSFTNDNTLDQMRNVNKDDNVYGAYYSWCAATAGTCGTATTDGSEVTSDICPKGWQLPKGGTGTGTNDFAMAAGLGSINIVADINYWNNVSNPSFTNNALIVNGVTWAAAGRVGTSGLLYTGSDGFYWSHTASTADRAYGLYFLSGKLYPASSDSRSAGRSVRCVAKKSSSGDWDSAPEV